MAHSLRQRIGAAVLDAPRYTIRLLLGKIGINRAWLCIRDRKQTISISNDPFGIRCHWQWTADLYLAKVFPIFSQLMLKQALNDFDFEFSNTPNENISEQVEVSFVIGHRGKDRLPLLLKTLETIAAQKRCRIECIVVELDDQPLIQNALPNWVKYKFKKNENIKHPYNRALAFNTGAMIASGNCIIFHDNDLIIPSNYASNTLSLVRKGYDFVNLKRFIFYLSECATHIFTSMATTQISNSFKIDSIMQNAEGGGSIGCSLKAFHAVGGFDQRFIGWGGEDNEFWERAQTLNIWPYGNQCLIHQWHGAQIEKLDLDNAPTLKLYRELSEQSPSARIAWLKENQVLEQEEDPCAV